MNLLLAWFLVLLYLHSTEFLFVLLIHGRHRVSSGSFLITKVYVLVMLAVAGEYLIESYFVPGMKQQPWISYSGVALVVIGDVLRKIAILTTWKAFTHDIKTRREEGHRLVTHGVYRFVRHPSYTGFFIWSIGTQVMLCNPVSSVAYPVAVWRFFESRIRYEEHHLRQLFGKEYEAYAQRVPSGIPFVK